MTSHIELIEVDSMFKTTLKYLTENHPQDIFGKLPNLFSYIATPTTYAMYFSINWGAIRSK